MLQEVPMVAIDMKLINRLQEGLPLEEDPYRGIGEDLGLRRSDVLDRIKSLMQTGYIRRVGGTFDSQKMGYSSVLIGAHVPEPVFEAVARYVNTLRGVTHNYRRSGQLNMWFTFCTENPGEKEDLFEQLETYFGITEVYAFPNVRNFKLHVFFDMEGR